MRKVFRLYGTDNNLVGPVKVLLSVLLVFGRKDGIIN